VKELKGLFEQSAQECKREAYLKSGALAEFPHMLFLVVPDETLRMLALSMNNEGKPNGS
jgi:hypothetical protein